MTSFVETLTPAAKEHAEARIDYYNDLTQAVLRSMQQLSETNLQFGRDWLDTSTAVLRGGLATPPGERAAELAPAAQATMQRLQAYHQQLAKLASEFQSEIGNVVKQHAPEAARTANDLVNAGQQAAKQKMSEEASRFARVAEQNQSMPQPGSMQSAEDQGNKN